MARPPDAASAAYGRWRLMHVSVGGYCPMGCGQTLVVLADPEVEHVVRLDETEFSLQHPLRERLQGRLLDCGMHGRITSPRGLRARVAWPVQGCRCRRPPRVDEIPA